MTLQEWCLQYSEWKDVCEYYKIGGGIGKAWNIQEWKDNTVESACIHERLSLYVRIIEDACASCDILLAVTEGIPPEILGLSSELVNNTYRIIENKLKIIRR